MPIGASKLSILSFPQYWDGNSVLVRFLCLPKGDPRAPLQAGLPSFADAKVVFQATLVGSLERLPLSGDGISKGPLVLEDPPDQKSDLFAELTRQFTIGPRRAPGPQPKFHKVLTESYRELIGDRQRSPFLVESKDFECALHEAGGDQPAQPAVLDSSVSWGRLIALALRQPRLASGLGILGQTTVTLDDPNFFSAGGWLYIELAPTSDYAATTGIAARYAARIPPLSNKPRALFAPLLFPVDPVDAIADDIFEETQLYEDGFAKQVHCAQGSSGDSIQLAWDDEQLGEWFERQVQQKNAVDLTIDAPNGISGYRVDVRLAGDLAWNSLLRIKSLGDLQLGPFSLGSFDGEGVVEVVPAQISPKQKGSFWFPSYFAGWRGSSLALTDPDIVNLHARPGVVDATTPQYVANREKNFAPVDDKAVRLKYGNTYEFRVRLADLTRGGPQVGVTSPEPPGHSITTITFRRGKSPGPVEIIARPEKAKRTLEISRPRLSFPEVLFTGAANFSNLVADLNFLAANPDVKREVSLPDPDVLTVEIAVQVKALDGDVDRYLSLYTTTRDFVGSNLKIPLDLQDHPTLLSLSAVQPDSGPLALPATRDVRLILTGLGRSDAGYFSDDKARRGASVTVDVRADGTAEGDLLADVEDTSSLHSFFFQPVPPGNTVPPPVQRLAAELGFDQAGLLLSPQAGERTVLGCSASLRHTISPDGASITFASGADLVQRWINVVQFNLLRDWTWDGLDPAGIRVSRTVHYPVGPDDAEFVGTIQLPHSLSPKARPDSSDPRVVVRQSSRLVFFDAFDPKPKLTVDSATPSPRMFPSEITIEYKLEPAYKGLPASAPVTRNILLPVTTPPMQVPRILSAGLALSNYEFADDYSSTNPRRRSLWFEFAEPPIDPEDAYFVRILGYGPDPMLLQLDGVIEEPADALEPPLPIDPEWMRMITPGQPRDENGLSAMRPPEHSPSSPAHYLIPLPENLDEHSSELFGFFVYEVRLGHKASRWSTAKGRFGPALRVAGVQHPAPPLLCQAERDKIEIRVRAPFATPVVNGANLRPAVPKTDLWALLYARVRQSDARAWRNVLLLRAQLLVPHAYNNPEDAGKTVLYGEGRFGVDSVTAVLRSLGLPADTPLTALAAEIFGAPQEPDPLGDRLGHARILRISSLISVPDAC
jgi:hypothetical protein